MKHPTKPSNELWREIERIAALPLEQNPCPHNTFVLLARALLDLRK